jgi:hypothetical protein
MLAIKAETVMGVCDDEARDKEKTEDAEVAIYCGTALIP